MWGLPGSGGERNADNRPNVLGVMRRSKTATRFLLTLVLSLALLPAGVIAQAIPASANTTFTAPDYPSEDCIPQAGGRNIGLAPQQWNAIAGLPLTSSGTPSAQRIVIGEFDETANEDAVNLLLQQCGLDPIDLIEHSNSNGKAGTTVG